MCAVRASREYLMAIVLANRVSYGDCRPINLQQILALLIGLYFCMWYADTRPPHGTELLGFVLRS